jgi:arsenate reductase
MAPLKILFICVGNTCRSPMAEVIARGQKWMEVEASSAGIMPFGRIVPSTVAALKKLGYDPRGLASKGLDDVDVADFDIIVSLLGPPGLSYLPPSLGAQLESWSIRDPYGEDDEVYLRVARDLERRIHDLLSDHDIRELPIG